MPGPIRISLDSPPPTEPGWYMLGFEAYRWLVVNVAMVDGTMRVFMLPDRLRQREGDEVSELKDARWSARLEIW